MTWVFVVSVILGITGKVLAQDSPKANPAGSGTLPPVVPLQYKESLIREENLGFTDAPDWADAPRGEHVFGGVAFRIDGMIELASRSSVARNGAFRERVTLPVPANSYASIHLLAATAWRSEANREIAEIIWQYADGGSRRTPILYAGHVRRVLRRAFEQPRHVLSPLSKCVVTWSSPKSIEEGGMMRLYRATFANPEPGRPVVSIQLQSSMDDASLVVLGISMDPVPAGRRPDPSLDLEPEDPEWTGLLNLSVTGPEGTKRVAGASVTAQIRTTGILGERSETSNGSGIVSLPIPKSGADAIELMVRAPGYADTRAKFESKPGSPLSGDLKVRLLEATELGGVVKDSGDKPVAGVAVEVYPFSIGDDPEFEGPEESMFSRRIVKTGADGRWVVEGVPVRNLRRVGVKFRHPNHSEVQIYSVTENVAVEAELREKRYPQRLESSARVVGVVTDPEGRPVPRARIWVGAMNSIGSRKLQADADGRFTLDGLTVQRTVFVANAEGLSPYANEFILEPGMQEVRIQLEKGSLFRGRVVGPDNLPLPRVLVRAESAGNLSATPWPKNLLAADFAAMTDEDGRWSWPTGPSLPMPFRFECRGYASQSTIPVHPNGDEVEVRLQRPVEVVGSVIDDETGQPVVKFQILPQGRRDYWGTERDFENRDGRFSLVLDKGTNGTLRFVAPTHTTQEESIPPANNGLVQMVVRLKRNDELSGTVVDESGAPVAGASVVLTGGSVGSLSLPVESPKLDPRVVRAGEDGRFRLRMEGAPLAIAAVGPDGFALVPLSEFRSNSRIQLQPYGSVEGVYQGWTETNRTAGLTLGLFSGEGSEQAAYAGSWTTPSTLVTYGGTFRFPKVPAGRHGLIRIVQADTGGTYSGLATVTVRPGQISPINITRQGVQVRIRLPLPPEFDERDVGRSAHLVSGLPFPVRPDMLLSQYRAFVEAPTNAEAMKAVVSTGFSIRRDGSFVADGVAPGDYDLVASGSEFPREGGPAYRFFGTRRVTVPAVANDSEIVDLGALDLKLQPLLPLPAQRKP